jgi:Bacterial transcriptional activator domain
MWFVIGTYVASIFTPSFSARPGSSLPPSFASLRIVSFDAGHTLGALECDAVASLAIGGSELAAAERHARRLIHLAPYRESGYRLLMEVFARCGDNAEALVVYESLRKRLRDELGAAPSPASQALHRRLLQPS